MKGFYQLELPLDDCVDADEIGDAALYNLFFDSDFSKPNTEPPWRGPGPNFLAEFRKSMTAKEYVSLLDEGVEALQRAIDEAFVNEKARRDER